MGEGRPKRDNNISIIQLIIWIVSKYWSFFFSLLKKENVTKRDSIYDCGNKSNNNQVDWPTKWIFLETIN